jgi:3-oxoacyl-[acyl-carrier-protein] synthase-3
MIGIKELGTYIPPQRESNYDKQVAFGIDEHFIQHKIGVEGVARKSADEETSDMCVTAFRALQEKTSVTPTEIDCIVVCTQNPDADGLPHTSAIVHGKLGCADSCAAFDISLGCSGYVYSLSVVQAFMEHNGLKRGLLFTADPYSKILSPEDKNTVLLFGDAASVTLLTDEPVLKSVRYAFSTRGIEGEAIRSVDKTFQMNGRAVFNFSAKEVPQQIQRLIEGNNLTLEDVDLILLHQGSKYIVDTIKKRLSLEDAKVPLGMRLYGNTVSSSIPLLLEPYLNDENFKTIVMSGFGVGLSWATGIFNRVGATD